MLACKLTKTLTPPTRGTSLLIRLETSSTVSASMQLVKGHVHPTLNMVTHGRRPAPLCADAFWEAQDTHIKDYSSTPIILWLQASSNAAAAG